jgi:hypothetical protein
MLPHHPEPLAELFVCADPLAVDHVANVGRYIGT